jgi:hypothetical protein
MTATALPPTASEPTDGFASGAPEAAPTPAPAAPAPAAPAATPAPAAPGAASLIGAAAAAPKFDFKAEGMHADDLKAFGDVLGEHKVDGKVGQAILDKMLPALSARREAAVKVQWEETQKGWREENAKDSTIDPSKPENQARAKLALEIAGADVLEDLKAKGLTDLPAFNRLVARFGAFVEKATKQDTAVPGASPTAAPKFGADNQSDKAWAAGMGIGF